MEVRVLHNKGNILREGKAMSRKNQHEARIPFGKNMALRYRPLRIGLCVVILYVLFMSPVFASASQSANTAHYDEIVTAINSLAPKIDVESWGYTSDDVFSLIHLVIRTHPEFYYYNSAGSICYSSSTTGKALYVEMSYTPGAAEQRAEIQAAVNRLTAAIDSSDMCEWEIALAVHDYLASNIRYAKDWYDADTLDQHPSVYTIYGALVEGKAVCNGYADTYAYILRNCYGIECCYVSSEAANHGWNVIRLNGKWYHVDVTGDDPVWDNLGRIQHNYFLLSKKTLLEMDPSRSDYVVYTRPDIPEPVATDNSMENGFWKGSETACCYYMGKWYYIDAESARLICADCDEGTSEVLLEFPEYEWAVWENSTQYWAKNFSRMSISGRKLYYSAADGVYTYDIESGETEKVYWADTSQGYVYGLGASGGELSCVVRTEPQANGFEDVTPLGLHTAHHWGPDEVISAPDYSKTGLYHRSCLDCTEKMSRIAGKVVRPSDVPAGIWYDDAVEWALGNKITSGTGKNQFSPNGACSRAQIVTFLWHTAGSPEPQSTSCPFTDVKQSDYFWKPLLWAWENGIIQGTSATTFSPERSCTCGQAATIMGRLGLDAGISSPAESICTRAQAVTILYRNALELQ